MRNRLIRSAGAVSLALGLAHAGVIVGVAQSPSISSWTPESVMSVKRISGVIPSPDGTRIAFVVGEAIMQGDKSEWLSQVHVANADGSDSRQLTRAEKSANAPRWSPDGKWIGFLTSRSGSGNVWRIPVAGGEAEQLTSEKADVASFDWSPDGTQIAFVMTDPKSDEEETAAKEKRDWRTIDDNVKMRRLYVQPVERDAKGGRQPRKLTTASYSIGDFDWSPDGRTIVFEHQPTPVANDWARSDISIVSVTDGAVRPLINSPQPEQTPRFSPDGTRVAFVGVEPNFVWATSARVHVVAASGGSPQALSATFDVQPAIVDWTADGTRIIASEVNRTVPMVYAIPVDGKAAVALSPAKTHVNAASMNARRTHLGFVSQDFDKAPEAFVAKMDGAFTPVQASHVQPAIQAAIGTSEVITWSSTDGQQVEGILTYPARYQRGTRVPLLLIVHGGPTGVFVNSFTGTANQYPVALFASQGYAVLRVNPRGSSGYGKAFRFANQADWGGGDYRDLMTGVDRVIEMGVADPDRLGVMGWSYGGYMTSWIVTQTKRFKAASAGAAVTNLISFNGTSDIPDFLPDYFKGEFWKAFESWRAHSPVLNANGVTTPTLIQHGEADVRVPVSQSYEFYTALKRQGATTKLTVYPRQGHGFTEPKMILDVARANLEWFDRFVMGKAATSTRR
jgi:dipeptidyl aminopeptidase/acylaminoacyl peptidase